MNNQMMIKKIDHLVITTSNIKECIAFYEKLGFKARDAGGRWELFSGDFKINVHCKGHELEPKAQYVQTGSSDLCFEIMDCIDMCKKRLQTNGISLESDIVLRNGVRGTMQSIYLRDPDGNLLELCSYA